MVEKVKNRLKCLIMENKMKIFFQLTHSIVENCVFKVTLEKFNNVFEKVRFDIQSNDNS
jgi:hypothetical protein